ncbi:unnamed protein product [Mytilus edulis]|uniref:Endonuclease/exonuclease/phosphatase domain-containing protein n=1 Tax=Mytilus edulis TaxID=6550 RepID=A0A8S3UMF9_MYTED|nr:unnamed protein product [Mytilus edulis]
MGNKRKTRNNSSKTGLTPPNKAASKMATHNQNISDVLTQAHESLHGSYIDQPENTNNIQMSSKDQTFTCSPNIPLQCPSRPMLQSTPLPGLPNGPPQQTLVPNFLPPPPPLPSDIPAHLSQQMIFNNINDTNQRIQRLEMTLNQRLAKLDMLDVLDARLGNFERNISSMKTEIENIKTVQQNQSKILQNEEQHHHNIEERVRQLEQNNMGLERENYEISERLLELKTHSMKYNLIFAGIPNVHGYEENTENVLRDFLNYELGIADSNNVSFQNVHRLGERQDGKHRSIIARFTSYNDHERVRKAAVDKLKNKHEFSVYQQYPREIYERRKQLIPKLKEFQRQKKKVKLVYDKLYVDGQLYNEFHPHQENYTIPGQPVRSNNEKSEFVLWVEIFKDPTQLHNLNSSVLLGCLYIPPEFSKYSSDEAFTEVEEELLKFSKNTEKVALVGDFNSRTRKLSDIVEIDEHLFEILDIDNEVTNDQNFMLYNLMTEKGIPTERFSLDNTRVNKYGKKLVELCKRCSICIANGRIGKDKCIGKTTCKDASLVDYLIVSPHLFDEIVDFEVIEFNPMFSDVHCRLHFSIDSAPPVALKTEQNNNKGNTHIKWNPQKAPEFEQMLSDDTDQVLQQVNGVLDHVNIDDVTPEQINGILHDVGSSLMNTASSVFGSRKRKQEKRSDFKPWFNTDCGYKWTKSSTSQFQDALCHPVCKSLLNNFMNHEYDNEDSERAVPDFLNIINVAATKANIFRHKSSKKRKPNCKWFDSDLGVKRKILVSKGELLSKFPYDPIVRGSYYKCYREYNKLRKYKMRTFKQSILNSLDNLRDSDPKQYWKLINSLKESTDDSKGKSVEPEVWFNHFSDLNKSPSISETRIKEINSKIENMEKNKTFCELDYRFSTKEIFESISKLKSGKASGLDGIPNEMLKAGSLVLNPLIQKLFNHVFSSGIYPMQWSSPADVTEHPLPGLPNGPPQQTLVPNFNPPPPPLPSDIPASFTTNDIQ